MLWAIGVQTGQMGHEPIVGLHSQTLTVRNENIKYLYIHLRIIKYTLVQSSLEQMCLVNIARHRPVMWYPLYIFVKCISFTQQAKKAFVVSLTVTNFRDSYLLQHLKLQ